jgi:hypothetical protein
MEKNPEPGSGMNIPDLIFESLLSVFWLKILKFFYADPDLGSCQVVNPRSGIPDGKIGSGLNIPNPQHWFRD